MMTESLHGPVVALAHLQNFFEVGVASVGRRVL